MGRSALGVQNRLLSSRAESAHDTGPQRAVYQVSIALSSMTSVALMAPDKSVRAELSFLFIVDT